MYYHSLYHKRERYTTNTYPDHSTGETPPVFDHTGARTNFLSLARWKSISKPPLQLTTAEYRSASGHSMPILGTTCVDSLLQTRDETVHKQLEFTVIKLNLNLIGLDTVLESGIQLDRLLRKSTSNAPVHMISTHKSLQAACEQLTWKFPDLWKDELGCLKNFQLEIKFKPDVTPEARTVPFAIQDDLSRA